MSCSVKLRMKKSSIAYAPGHLSFVPCCFVELILLLVVWFQGKVIVVNEHLTPVYDDHVSFDNDLPEFG